MHSVRFHSLEILQQFIFIFSLYYFIIIKLITRNVGKLTIYKYIYLYRFLNINRNDKRDFKEVDGFKS